MTPRIKNSFFIALTFLIAPGLLSFQGNKKFPRLNHQTIDGKIITNDFFKDRKTVVILAHIGCPAAMLLLKDMQEFADEKQSFQTLIILENTAQQVIDFNSDKKTVWSVLRNHFQIDPITTDVIADCASENIKKEGDDLVIGTQCRNLSKKLNTESFPNPVLC